MPPMPPMPPIPDGGADPDDDNDVEIECQRCGYVWMYSGSSWYATCPRCQRKTPSPYNPDYEAEDDEE